MRCGSRASGCATPASWPNPHSASRSAGYWTRPLKLAKEILGDHQDACVAQERIRELLPRLGTPTDPQVLFVAGRMTEREHARAKHLRTLWWNAWLHVSKRGELTLSAVLTPPPACAPAGQLVTRCFSAHPDDCNRRTASSMRSSVAVAATRTCRAPEGP